MKYTAKDYNRVCELYASDVSMSSRRIEQITGINRQTICDWVRQAGLTRTRNASRETPVVKLIEAKRIYCSSDLSLKAVSRRTGVDRKSLRRALDGDGLRRSAAFSQSRMQRRYNDAQCALVFALRERGLKWREISERLSIPQGSLSSLYFRHVDGMKQDRLAELAVRREARAA